MHTPFKRFIEASPHVHRAKQCRPSATMFPSSTIEPSLKPQTRRGLCVVVGLHTIQDPGQNTSADLTQQRAELPLKRRHLLGSRLIVEKLIKQANALGE
jgi:hypothetical protein